MGKLSLKDSSWSLEVKKTECSLKPAHLIPWAPPVSLLLIPVKQFERAVVAVAHGGIYQKRHLESQSTELSSHVSDAEKGGITFDWVWEKDSLALTMLNLRVSKYPKERGRSTDFQFKSKKSGSVLYGSGNRWHPSHSWSKEKECTLGKNARWSEERNVGRILGSSVLTVWGGGEGERTVTLLQMKVSSGSIPGGGGRKVPRPLTVNSWPRCSRTGMESFCHWAKCGLPLIGRVSNLRILWLLFYLGGFIFKNFVVV